MKDPTQSVEPENACGVIAGVLVDTGWRARRVCRSHATPVLSLVLVALLGAEASAQGLSGTWTEEYARESVSIKSWGEHCGKRPTGKTRGSARAVEITASGGVISVPAARIRSDRCQYVSAARKVSYSAGAGYSLVCSTPPGASPRESATYRFLVGDGGKSLKYVAKVSAYWRLEGDTCEASITYTRLFTRKGQEPVAAEGEATPIEVPTEVADKPPSRVAEPAPEPTPEPEEEETTLLIPVTIEQPEGPAGGSANPVVTTRKVKSERNPLAATWWVFALMVIVVGLALVVAAVWLIVGRRRHDRPVQEKAAGAMAGRASQLPAAARELAAGQWTKATMVANIPTTAHSEVRPAASGSSSPPGSNFKTLLMPQTDRLDTAVSVRVCPKCDRRFDVAATFCPFDGANLDSVEEQLPLADVTTASLRCPECNGSFSGGAFCPEDGCRLVAENPLEQGYVAVPLMICSVCQEEFLPGQTECPNDGTALLPVVGRRTGGLPLQGLGPKSKICPDCGLRYAGDAEFCGKDGATLVPVN